MWYNLHMEEKVEIETISWRAPEYTHKPKSNDWHWGLGVIALAGIGLTIWLGSYVFSVFIFLSAVVLIMLSIRAPREIGFEINSDGILIETTFYPYKKIKGFTIEDGSPFSKLIIERDKNFLPIHTIPIPKELSQQIKDSLIKIIPMIDIHEQQVIQFAEKIGL